MEDILRTGSVELGAPLNDGQIRQLRAYAELLKEWNEKINLTAITEDAEIATKHFLDSMTTLCTGRVKGRVIDVGTGAGFPGLVLKIADPTIQLTLLDSLAETDTFSGSRSRRTGYPGCKVCPRPGRGRRPPSAGTI